MAGQQYDRYEGEELKKTERFETYETFYVNQKMLGKSDGEVREAWNKALGDPHQKVKVRVGSDGKTALMLLRVRSRSRSPSRTEHGVMQVNQLEDNNNDHNNNN